MAWLPFSPAIRYLRIMLQVVCAIVERGEFVLAACRGPEMRDPWKWEFPGGKVEAGETKEAALHRELAEELSLEVDILEAMAPVTYEGRDISIQLWPFRCSWTSGEPLPLEHAETVWIRPADLATLDFSAPDLTIISQYHRLIGMDQLQDPWS